MMSGLGHTSLSHAACIATTAATAPITPDVPLSPVPRYNIVVFYWNQPFQPKAV